MKEFQQYFHNIFPDLTSFSFSLIPDQLQANQIVLDAISVLLLKEKELLEQMLSEDNNLMDFHRFRLKINLYKNIFKIAEKRAPQLSSSILPGEDKAAFYAVDISARAVVYLKHKTNFEFLEMQEILDKSNSEVISLLQVGRKQFSANLGLQELN